MPTRLRAAGGRRERQGWRVMVAAAGRILISVGLLMFAFVAYQLWGTGIQTARAQSQLTDELETLFASTTTLSPDVVDPGTGTSTPTGTTTPGDTTPTTTPTTTTPTGSGGIPIVITSPRAGDPIAFLDIPAIGLARTVVIEGVEPDDLARGPGHFPETPLPGQLGNAALAGHRTTHGQPFYRIDELAPGDEIVVTTLTGRYTYRVTGTRIVSPEDYNLVIPTVDPTQATLTLTSCHPKYSSRKRIVVSSTLDPTASDRLVTTATTTTTTTATTAPPTTEAGPEPSATTEPSEIAPPTTEAGIDDSGARTQGADVFANRWFSDPSAWSQVILWGLALTAVAIGAWMISVRSGRNSIGFLVGVVPFVVVLYFFFENVNRLLPPNL